MSIKNKTDAIKSVESKNVLTLWTIETLWTHRTALSGSGSVSILLTCIRLGTSLSF